MREAALRFQDAIVTVQFDFGAPGPLPMGGGPGLRMRIDGTLVDATGLVVCSSDRLEVAAFRGRGPGHTGNLASGSSDIRVLLSDGRELAARIVLEQLDLGVVVLRLRGGGHPLITVPIDPDVKLDVLDRVFIAGSASGASARTLLLFEDTIAGVTPEPRARYVLRSPPATGLPVFTTGGRCAGILVAPSAPREPGAATLAALLASAPGIVRPAEMLAILRRARSVE